MGIALSKAVHRCKSHGVDDATVDIISFDDMSDMDGDIDCFQIGVGIGAGMDINLTETYTNNIKKFNIFDILLKILGQEECG